MAATKTCPDCRTKVAADLRHCPNCPYSFPEEADELSPDSGIAQNWSPVPFILMLGMAAAFGGIWKLFFQVGGDSASVMSEVSLVPGSETKKKKKSLVAPEGHWLFKGAVRDLVTLEPVRAARLSFRSASGVIEAVPDEQGLYAITLPAAGAYQVQIRAQGYAPSYLNPNLEDVPELDSSRRKELAQELRQARLPPYEVQGYDTAPLTIDFFLAPAR
jgi:hypothetical protein